MNEADEAEIDRQLIVEIRAGDREALARLYDRHSAKLMRIIYNILNNLQDSEDLLHDIYLEVWRKADNYSEKRGSVLVWLIIRTRSRALDRRRSLQLLHQRYLANDPGSDYQGLATSAITETSLEYSMNERVISKAMSQLSKLQRAVVQSSYFQGLTYQEIAQLEGIPLGTVKSRLSAAIHKLSLYFAEEVK